MKSTYSTKTNPSLEEWALTDIMLFCLKISLLSENMN